MGTFDSLKRDVDRAGILTGLFFLQFSIFEGIKEKHVQVYRIDVVLDIIFRGYLLSSYLTSKRKSRGK